MLFKDGDINMGLQFSHSVMSDSLQSHGMQLARLPCPSPTPRAYLNSYPSSWWCHPTISSSVIAFSSCLQSFQAPGSFQMSQFFESGGQNTGVSAPALTLPMNFRTDFLRMDWLDLLVVQGILKHLLQHHTSKASILQHSAFFMGQFSHLYVTAGKIIALTRRTFVGKVMSVLFNMLSRLVITFLPRSKCLNFMAVVTICSDFGAPQNKVFHCFHYFPIYFPWSDGTRCHDLRFLSVKFKANFFTLLFHFHQEALLFFFTFCLFLRSCHFSAYHKKAWI